MAQPSLKIDRARYVLTVDPQRRIIRDGSIVIERGRIVRVGKADELADASADRVIDAREFVVTPGFVNGHMHISYAHPVRGIFPDDLGSPLKHVFALQMAMTEEEEYQTSSPCSSWSVTARCVSSTRGRRNFQTPACRPTRTPAFV